MAKDKLFVEAEIRLYSYKKNKILIDKLTTQIQYIINKYSTGRHGLPGEKAITYDKVKTSKTNSSPIEDWLLNNDKEYDQLLTKKIKLVKEINLLENAFKFLDEKEMEVIKLRYINPISWEEVAYKLGYSKSHCKRLRVQAINKIKDVI